MPDETDIVVPFPQLVHEEVERYCRDASSIDDQKLKVEQFTQFAIDILAAADQLDDGTICNYAKTVTNSRKANDSLKVNGYDFNEIENSIDLFVCSDYNGTDPAPSYTKPQIDELFNKCRRFFEAALGDLYTRIDQSHEAYNLAHRIHLERHKISRVRYMLFLDGFSKTKEKDSEKSQNIDFIYRIYDLNALEKYSESTKERPPIEIDLRSFGEPLPCLPIVSCGDDFDACVAMMSGDLLYKLYGEHGSRLLERNIRSFLQAKNKINKGIKDTIFQCPERFLAYNNGISCTAEHVDFEFKGESCKILKIRNFQIVNGGQTTASIYNAFRINEKRKEKDRVDLRGVQVQAKISIIKNPAIIDDTVKKISLYANSQNKVSQSDFDALEPFHAKMEEFSRTVWAPPSPRHNRMTKWYYERARGAYGDEKSRGSGRRSAFTDVYPENQVFTKTDLARYESVWEELPQSACLGEQKNFRAFTNRSAAAELVPDRQYFMDAVAKKLVYDVAAAVIKQAKLPSYKAQTASYCLAYVLHYRRAKLDLKDIWKTQTVPGFVEASLKEVVLPIHKRLSESLEGQNVTEWCKKDTCWNTIRDLKITLPTVSP